MLCAAVVGMDDVVLKKVSIDSSMIAIVINHECLILPNFLLVLSTLLKIELVLL